MNDRTYVNFDLIIEKSGEKYRARVINSPCGQATVEFGTPFSPLELENFVLRMGRPQRGMRRIDSPEMEAVKLFGSRLFQTVFHDDVYACYLRSMDNALNQNHGLRIRLRINIPELHDLPWEYLYNSQVDQFLALSRDTPIIRYVELPYTTQALPVAPPLKILLMISSPEGYPSLNVEEEWKRLNIALQPLLDRDLVVLEKLEQPTLIALQKRLRQDQVHIFHYIGHGKYFEQKQDGMLLLEDENHHGRPTSGQHIGAILHDHHTLRLVVLNACEGARTSAEDPYAGVAQTLVRQGIPAVLAMQFEIFEDAAMTFAQEFYSALVDNYPVDAALSEARKAIFANGNDVEWGTPVLFTRAGDGVLFKALHYAKVPKTEEAQPATIGFGVEAEAEQKVEDESRPLPIAVEKESVAPARDSAIDPEVSKRPETSSANAIPYLPPTYAQTTETAGSIEPGAQAPPYEQPPARAASASALPRQPAPRSWPWIMAFLAVATAFGLFAAIGGYLWWKSQSNQPYVPAPPPSEIVKPNPTYTLYPTNTSYPTNTPYPTGTAYKTNTSPPRPTSPPAPTDPPKPVTPYFTAGESMYCRDGPSISYDTHYDFYAGDTIPVIGKWYENPAWILVDINVPETITRTDCCWVSGNGTLNVSIDQIKTITFVPNRLDCSAVK